MTPQVVFGAIISRMIRRILLITLTVISLDTATLLSQTEAEWEWTNKHFGQALDTLMPLQRVAGLYVVCRAHRDLRTDVPEYWFLIGRDQNEKGYGLHTYLSAHVRAAETLSIYDQLRSMRRSNEQGDAVSITQKIKLQTWDLNETNRPAIKDEVEKPRGAAAEADGRYHRAPPDELGIPVKVNTDSGGEPNGIPERR